MALQIRIRRAFIIALLVLGWLPLAAFGWYSYDRTIKREFSEVEDRHFLLARNLSSALSRYEKDVRATVQFIAISLGHDHPYPGAYDLLDTLKIQMVTTFDPADGSLLNSTDPMGILRPDQVDPSLLTLAMSQAADQPLMFTPVYQAASGNRIFLVGKSDAALILASINTDYFRELAGQISFGVKGHAAIVDQSGNVLAHPLPAWVAEAKNISKISSVARMMNGETGIEQFYSPALKGDMIAGLTAVKGPGWGVMIPQPVSEIYGKAMQNLAPVLWGLLSAIVAAFLLVSLAIRWLAKPLENFTSDLVQQAQEGMPVAVPLSRRKTSIYELQNIFNAYNALAVTVQTNARDMSEKALQDPITGIGNRAYFEKHGAAQITDRLTMGERGVFVFLDLDGFKEINDTRGHEVGDAYLATFAQGLYPAAKRVIARNFGPEVDMEPVVGRIGGDEFAIMLPVPCDVEDVWPMCEELRQSVPKTVEIDGVLIPCNASAGGAIYPDQGSTVSELIRKADVALYMAKARGKDGFEMYSRINELGGKSEILSAVLYAIENDQMFLEYQPKYCLHRGIVGGAEALLRWNHPDLGRVAPDIYLPVILKTHVMARLGEWVTERAILDMQAMDREGHKLTIAINIGSEHFSAPGFTQKLIEQCREAGVDPARLQIEVTEDVLEKSQETFGQVVSELQAHGFSVAIDDFGKGYSNFSRLASIPVDVIKLDRSLIREAVGSSRFQVIMQSAVDMSHALGSKVVLEGVESLEDIAMAEKVGVDGLQGFYFTKSLAPDDLVEWMRAQTDSQSKAG